MDSTFSQTPSHTTKILEKEIDDLNDEFSLGIPNPKVPQPPNSQPLERKSKEHQCHYYLKYLFWKDRQGFDRALSGCREQLREGKKANKQWVHKPNQDDGAIPSGKDFLETNGYSHHISSEERLKRVSTLFNALYSEVCVSNGGKLPGDPQSPCRTRDLSNGPPQVSDSNSTHERSVPTTPNAKRKPSMGKEVFRTTPSSPILPIEVEYPVLSDLDEYDDPIWNEPSLNTDNLDQADDLKYESQQPSSKKRQTMITEHMLVTKSSQNNRSTINKPGGLSSPFSNTASASLSSPSVGPNISFTTTIDSVFDHSEQPSHLGTSFGTAITEPFEDVSAEVNPLEGVMISEEASTMSKSPENDLSPEDQKILDDLLQNGPFSAKRECFSPKVPLRARYELERTRLHWTVEPKQILVGDKPFEKYDDFWKWLEHVGHRMQKNLPEKPALKAWNAAIGPYEGERLSEAVVLTGALDWCDKGEAGIFKLRLNPLKIDRACRFHRRFGSDRFLSITMPSVSQWPRHLGLKDQSTPCRILAKWLSKYDHHLLKRKWRAFFVEDVKNKTKFRSDEPRVRVDFFAIDGSDFATKFHSPRLSPSEETCESRTRMTIDQFLQWHIPLDDNRHQTDCKLFNRISLALSKTWATMVLRPDQIKKLLHDQEKPVMNDGCALMSRSLARAICDQLGIDGATPSSFQGRIAGTKGLWMVDRHQENDDSLWIEISQSQLKVNPHPCDMSGLIDKEKMTFEVVNWSKPLQPAKLNTQLLEVLNSCGQVEKLKARVAEITRTAIENAYMEFKTVMDKDSIPLARALMQKIRPTLEDGSSRTNLRRVDKWLTQNVETVIRFLEAGFSPRNFSPLRDRMRRCLSDILSRYVDELHIPIPLSTYTFCIADPYGILEENEVHFAFSSQWKGCSYFEDFMLDGVDVLVGRTPAHCPWDVQRRKAVWKPGLRHFTDVIVFSTKGTTPLASLLSGGDYDGDQPWICWDQGIVETFTNASPPNVKPGPDHFGLVNHARALTEMKVVSELLEGAFEFNLAPSNLGLCTNEHERLAYDKCDGIRSLPALQLSTLLSYLVDSRKSGFQLTDKQWQRYRKSISPIQRNMPAYKDLGRKEGNRANINDYIKFEIASKEKERALERFSQQYGSTDDIRDEDLVRPWREVLTKADREMDGLKMQKSESLGGAHHFGLYEALKRIETQIYQAYDKWKNEYFLPQMSTGVKVQFAAELLAKIHPPEIDHPLCYTWQNSDYEWQALLASGVYYLHWRSAFPLYAAGETLCRIKTGKEPARLIRDQIYTSMKINSSIARQLAGAEAEAEAIETEELESDPDADEFDRKSINDALLELDRLRSGQAETVDGLV